MENFASTGCATPGDVRKKQQAGENIRIIDVRSREEFDENHIPGALHLPLEELENSISGLDVNNIFVAACGKGGGRSAAGAEILQRLGFRATWLCGGTFGWLDEK
ncbi:MAG: rhodanese-like domain-containing protein [Saprospiraceae bacterium]|nr:rhodanese-like domain-containing protein [Saprospiraceae bacterium]MCF8251553.1 rhodanese-like domain-containing protein [Saprospiraceae bacterium]MCF8280883.1 rhodanese-like domain-containing protein [Bacteroidales bacterium]MCF8310937.1 rhodanese-like domain-containing protein [Saprospiraceae bacterium]MCF8439727.1 rhodanese-like domain-containing protein [Saprospiraceae bacterium]